MAPIQDRARRTRETILEALERLLTDQELEAISIGDIAKEAGVAVGSVYSHFKDKAALLPALTERRLDRAEQQVEALETLGAPRVGEGADLRSTVEALVRMAQLQVRADRGSLRALLTHRRLHPERATPRRDALNERSCRAFAKVLEPYRAEIVHAELDQAAKMVFYVLSVSFLDEAMFAKPLLPEAVTPSEEQKLEAYTEMVYRYLTG